MTLRIANTEEDKWQSSNTYELIDAISTRNQQLEGVFIHQVRMIKQIARHAGVDIPGIHIESYAFKAILTKVDHPVAVAAALRKGAEMLAGDYFDPTGEDLISSRLSPTEKVTYQLAFCRWAEKAEQALTLAAGDDEGAAIAIWAELFGDPFPQPDNLEASFLKSLSFGSGLNKVGVSSDINAATKTRAWCPPTCR